MRKILITFEEKEGIFNPSVNWFISCIERQIGHEDGESFIESWEKLRKHDFKIEEVKE